MNISKTTFNFAKRHGLDLTVEDFGDVLQLCIWEADNDCEWLCSYRINYDCLTWHGNIYLPQEVKEELPATINNEVFFAQSPEVYCRGDQEMINEVDFELAEAHVRAKKMGLRILTQTVEFPSMPLASFHKVTAFSSKREFNALIPIGDDKRMAKFINESCDILKAVKHG